MEKKHPKLVIASDGKTTGMLLDNVFFGQGVTRLEFTTENKDGKIASTIRMDLDANRTQLEMDPERFAGLYDALARKV